MAREMLFNPFRPGAIVTPGMFFGRINEVNAIEACLFQTMHGNPRHFLIEGERGIGKSSLMLFVKLLASGQIKLSNKLVPNFVVVDVELNGSSTDLEILAKIGKKLRLELTKAGSLKLIAKGVIEFLTNWKALGVEYKKTGNILDPIEAVEELAQAVADLIGCAGTLLDGIVILIDEADKPEPDKSRLGEMLKLFTERLTRLGCERVCIGLAGLPILVSKLRLSHESSPRMFESLLLDILSVEDRIKVINAGIKDANEKNVEKVSIDTQTATYIAILSEGYPHFLQEFAYAAFHQDEDYIITRHDVREAIFKKNGAIHQLGKRYFEALYYEKISSTDYRKVLQGMADRFDAWISRQDITELSKIKASQVNNALSVLKSRGIILANEEKRGEYRLPSKSFAVWLKILGEKADEVLGQEPG